MFVPCSSCGNAMFATEQCPHCGAAPKQHGGGRSASGARSTVAYAPAPEPEALPFAEPVAEAAGPVIIMCPLCGNARLAKEPCPHCNADAKPAASNRFAKGTTQTEASPAETAKLEKQVAAVALAFGILAIIGGVGVLIVHGFKPPPVMLSTTGVSKTTVKANPEGSVYWGHYSTNIHYTVNGKEYLTSVHKDTKDGTPFTIYYPADNPAKASLSPESHNYARYVGFGFAGVGLVLSAIAGLILTRKDA